MLEKIERKYHLIIPDLDLFGNHAIMVKVEAVDLLCESWYQDGKKKSFELDQNKFSKKNFYFYLNDISGQEIILVHFEGLKLFDEFVINQNIPIIIFE